MNAQSFIVGIIVATLIAAIVIWVVGRLGLGLRVSGFGPALLAAIVIAVLAAVVNWLLVQLGINIGGGLLGAIVHLIISAFIIMIAGRFVKGLVVKGFTGALVAAIVIAVIYWLITPLVGKLPGL